MRATVHLIKNRIREKTLKVEKSKIDKTMENEKDLELEKDVEIDTDQIEDEELKKTLQTVSAQKKHYREKFQKSNSENEELKKKVAELEALSKKDTKVENQVPTEKNTQESAEFAKKLSRIELQVKGYSEDEIEFIEKVGGKDALGNEYVKTAIEQMRAKKKSEEADPESDSRSPVYKKYTEADLKKMSAAELEKVISKLS